jgi:hypothetical protein
MVAITAHVKGCPARGKLHSDAAKRVSDTYRLHSVALGNDAIGKWFAVALHDGTSDGVLYDNRRDAVRHQHHNEQWYAFVCIAPGDMPICDAEAFIDTARKLYDAGFRMTDPDHRSGGRELVRRATIEDQRSMVRSLASGGRRRPSNLKMPYNPN